MHRIKRLLTGCRLSGIKVAGKGKEMKMTLPRHGSAADRGSADAYYGRKPEPHEYVGNSYTSERIDLEPTDPRYREYMDAYESETERKDWG